MKKHDRVFHKRLGKDGVILEVLKTGALKVALGNLIVECRPDDLTPMKKGQGGAPALATVKSRAATPSRKSKRPASKLTVDLHGMRVEEALRVVEEKINLALLSEIDSVEVVHGVGTGALRVAIHRYLDSLPIAKHYRLDEVNPGVTWVYF